MSKKLVLATAILFGVTGAALAEFPEKPITIVVPNGAGSTLNAVARVYEPYLEAELGVPVNVEVMPGAGTTLGSRHVIESEPDGYTILMSNENLLGVFGQNKLDPYQLDSLTPIVKAGGIPTVLVGRPGMDGDPLELLKASSSEAPMIAAVQIGALSHLVMLDLAAKSGATFRLIHQGGGEQVKAALAGKVDVTVLTVVAAKQHHEAGTLKVMAIGTQERLDIMPDVPTFAELGLDVNFKISWLFFVPKGTPADRVEKLEAAFTGAFNNPEVEAKYAEMTMVDRTLLTDEALTEYVEKQANLMKHLAETSGLRK
ncbi:tripartite tricarboxylate transporter substrate binding protein [Pararhizobium sp. IMCC21322]|uniref:Bug family tripartite tricarboxylate transporter substrate binding protein n=1 Tax=Pararhizobium sp. IMCC21322 TaxID=3067903 RepID=UPI00274207E6|nr:tripartite tricarboxylate transporter substrate binding protein [Pararhizobium sp. IMCC21322]